MANGEAQGIDVSHYQGAVSWPEVFQAGIQFAFAKATDGLTWVDPQFAVNWPGMKAAGLLRGAYHFFEPADAAAAQAEFFLQNVQLETGDLPPALDVETPASSSTALWQGVETWLQTVAAATGMKPFLYVAPDFADQYLAPASLAAYPLWIADYVAASQPTLPAGWSDWLIWQQSEGGSVSGVTGSVDLDRINGSIASLVAIVKG
jgi:lysozyme